MSDEVEARSHLSSVEADSEYLRPGSLRLFRDAGRLRLTVEGDRSYLDVRVARAFPLSDPEEYIGLLDNKDRVIGMVKSLEVLDSASRRTAREALDRRYFTPTIRRILSMREEHGVHYCRVETDYGLRRFAAKGIRDQMLYVAEDGLMITDVDGNRYRIHDWKELDARSRRCLQQLV